MGTQNSESSSAALENDIDKEMGAVKAIFVHLRPILNNIFRLLYVVVRPIMMLLLAQRHVLMDWEKPGLTAVYCVVYFWSWYHDMQFAVFFTFMLFHVAYWVWQGQVPVRYESKVQGACGVDSGVFKIDHAQDFGAIGGLQSRQG